MGPMILQMGDGERERFGRPAVGGFGEVWRPAPSAGARLAPTAGFSTTVNP